MKSEIVSFMEKLLRGFDLDDDIIWLGAKLKSDMGLSSAELVDVTLSIKKAFDVDFHIASSEDPSLSDVCDCIQSHILVEDGMS